MTFGKTVLSFVDGGVTDQDRTHCIWLVADSLAISPPVDERCVVVDVCVIPLNAGKVLETPKRSNREGVDVGTILERATVGTRDVAVHGYEAL